MAATVAMQFNDVHFFPNQGSLNRPHLESSSQSPSLSLDSHLKGLQVELSETCALCLSRLLSLISLPPEAAQSLADEALVSPPSDDVVQPTSSLQQHMLFKLDCCLEDVNVFTVSNLAGTDFKLFNLLTSGDIYVYVHVCTVFIMNFH